MADFGEYLPTDTFLHNGVSAEIMHNARPALWAKCNYEALEETGKLGEILFFMRAGYTGSQKHSVMMWAGIRTSTGARTMVWRPSYRRRCRWR